MFRAFPAFIFALAPAAFAADGIFLVASEELQDPNFERTVVLVTRTTPFAGPFGVIINRPIPITVAEALPDGGLPSTRAIRPGRRDSSRPRSRLGTATEEPIGGNPWH